jgi:hypothetical protein
MPSTGIPQDSCAERMRILCGTRAVPVTCLMFPHKGILRNEKPLRSYDSLEWDAVPQITSIDTLYTRRMHCAPQVLNFGVVATYPKFAVFRLLQGRTTNVSCYLSSRPGIILVSENLLQGSSNRGKYCSMCQSLFSQITWNSVDGVVTTPYTESRAPLVEVFDGRVSGSNLVLQARARRDSILPRPRVFRQALTLTSHAARRFGSRIRLSSCKSYKHIAFVAGCPQ